MYACWFALCPKKEQSNRQGGCSHGLRQRLGSQVYGSRILDERWNTSGHAECLGQAFWSRTAIFYLGFGRQHVLFGGVYKSNAEMQQGLHRRSIDGNLARMLSWTMKT